MKEKSPEEIAEEITKKVMGRVSKYIIPWKVAHAVIKDELEAAIRLDRDLERKRSAEAMEILKALDLSVKWELADSIKIRIKELVTAYEKGE